MHPPVQLWQPELFGYLVRLRPIGGGALEVIEQKSGRIIGKSSFLTHDPSTASVEIGATMIEPEYRARGFNRELKLLMLSHAFQFVDRVWFRIETQNLPAQAAIAKIGAIPTPLQDRADFRIYELSKELWNELAPEVAPRLTLPTLETLRMRMTPIHEQHAELLWDLYRDPVLHRYVPYRPGSLEKQRERCARWEKARSADGKELFLNWIAHTLQDDQPVGHYQAGLGQDGIASIGYLVSRAHQGKGLATEGIQVVLRLLTEELHAREVKAWADSRNLASHRVAEKLGLRKVDVIKDANFFDGAPSDEYVFSLKLN
jgi:RimJ/RimL family protein N-acetyltransferase